MNQDKPRITSTVILSLFLIVNALMASLLFSLTINNIEAQSAGEAFALAFIAVIGGAFLFIAFGGIIISSAICLIFTIFNRHSTIKAIRIISYVYDGLFGAIIALSVIKIILMVTGIY